jgi:hypothetical protein
MRNGPLRLALHLAATLLAALVLGAPWQPIAARAETADLKPLADEVVHYVVMPRYAALAAETAAQRDAWTAFCAAPTASGTAALVDAFGRAAGAWASIELIRFGPIAEAFRYERMAHFPERKSAITRGLAGLLAGRDPADLSPARFKDASVAVQGLSALERVLFDEGAREKLAAKTEEGRRRCAVGLAIAGSLAGIAAEVRDEWASGSPSTRLEPKEVLVRAFTDLVTLDKLLFETKTMAVMGTGADNIKPKLAEYWRSGLTDRAIQLNLASAHALVTLIAASKPEAATAVYTAASAVSIAEGADAPFLTLAADPARWHRAMLLVSAIRSAHNTALEVIPPVLDITVGFNSLDGD